MNKLKLLIIEPKQEDQYVLQQIFNGAWPKDRDDQELFFVETMPEAISLLVTVPDFDAVLLCPESGQLHEEMDPTKLRTEGIPLIVLDCDFSEARCTFLFEKGITDYLVKGLYPAVLVRKAVWNAVERGRITGQRDAVIQDLQAKNEALLKFAALGEVASSIAHEINTPLSTILMNAEFIRDEVFSEVPDRENIARMLVVIGRTTLRIADIVRTLRDLSKRENEEQFTKVSLLEIAIDALELFAPKAKSLGIRISLEDGNAGGAYVIGGFTELLLVVINLLNNAVDALEGCREGWIRMRLEESRGLVILSVEDNGCGIDPQIEDKIFDHFFTTKKGHGVGLGLNISEKIVAKHQGRILLSSKANPTVFNIELPVYAAAHEESDYERGN